MCPWEWVAEAGVKGEITGIRGQENVRWGAGWITAWLGRLKRKSVMSKNSIGGEDRQGEGAEVVRESGE